MKYRILVNGKPLELEASGDVIAIDGSPVAASFVATGKHTGSLCVSGRLFRIAFEHHGAAAGERTPGRSSARIWIDGDRFDVEALDELALRLSKLAGAAGTRHVASSIVAPMPGLIRAVLVTEGSRVAAAQGVVVMEAMKMENELRAPIAGTVTRIHVQPGKAVEKGTILVELEA